MGSPTLFGALKGKECDQKIDDRSDIRPRGTSGGPGPLEHQAIVKVIAGMPGNRPAPPPEDGKPALRPAAGRHQITNIVIKVTGNKAVGRSSWFHVGNDNPQRANTIGGFGHYEDELVKVNGQWFFTKRKIYNEGSARWQYKGTGNPVW